MSEELRDIPGYEGSYAASRDGRVWSRSSKAFLRPYLRAEYLTVCLRIEGRPKNLKVHRLVALAWIPNAQALPITNHIDGDKLNNTVENLEWCDSTHNNRHAFRIGLQRVVRDNRGCFASHARAV